MVHRRLLKLFGFLLAFTLAACAAYRSQQTFRREGEVRPSSPQVASIAPDRAFSELAEADQVARIRGAAELVKETLAREGRYACCVEPACTECLLKYGECHCREALREEGPCCGECTEMWVEGKGTVEGISAWEVLERKKDVLRRVNERGGAAAPEEPPPHHHHPHP